MGRKAQQQTQIPGPPTRLEGAYLAGLIDRGGGLTTSPPGLKLRCSGSLGIWLQRRFGGHIHVERQRELYWWVTRQAELNVAIGAARPFAVTRAAEMDAMLGLLRHLMDPARPWHGSPEWRQERDRLKEAVRELRRP